MSRVATSWSDPVDLDKTMDRITQSAVGVIPGTSFASISVRHDNGRLETFAATDPLVEQADALQYELNEGPCYDALTVEAIVSSSDLAHDARWPHFALGAHAMGISSQLAIGLAHRGKSFTALNLYSRDTGAFEGQGPTTRVYVGHARIALGYARELHALHAALSRRTTIARATGIIMQRNGLDAEAALDTLGRVAKASRLNLWDMAARIVESPDAADQAAT